MLLSILLFAVGIGDLILLVAPLVQTDPATRTRIDSAQKRYNRLMTRTS